MPQSTGIAAVPCPRTAHFKKIFTGLRLERISFPIHGVRVWIDPRACFVLDFQDLKKEIKSCGVGVARRFRGIASTLHKASSQMVCRSGLEAV
jgi:hypothetical protein